MDYTRSDANITDAGTGRRMHQSDQPVPTEVSAKDMNMVIWSLMTIIESAGLSGVDFDIEDSDSYSQLLAALRYHAGPGNEGANTVIYGPTATPATFAAANAAGRPVRFVGLCSVVGATLTVPIAATTRQIFSETAGVTIDNGQSVRAEWFGSAHGYAQRAVNALPASGGEVTISINRPTRGFDHAYGTSYISKDNVTIRGVKMPRIGPDARSLVGGTIVRGTTLAWCNNIEFREIGVDCGKTTVDDLYGGNDADALMFTFGTPAAKAANELRKGVKLHNVIALGPRPAAATHGIILGEGYDDVNATGSVVGAMCTHPLAVKCSNFTAESVTGYLSNREGFIFKSDAQTTSVCREAAVARLTLTAQGPAGVTPYIAATPIYGLLFEAVFESIDKIKIGRAKIVGFPASVSSIIGAGKVIRGVHIDSLESDQFGVGGFTYAVDLPFVAGTQTKGWSIGNLEARNCTAPIRAAFANADAAGHLSVGRLFASQCSHAADLSGQAYVTIGTLVTDSCSISAFKFSGGTPLLRVGTFFRDPGTPTDYSGDAPSLSNGWTDYVGFRLDLRGGRVYLSGRVQPGSSNVITTCPRGARPAAHRGFLGQAYNDTTITSAQLSVNSDTGVVTVNAVAGGTANCSTWLSFGGANWA